MFSFKIILLVVIIILENNIFVALIVKLMFKPYILWSKGNGNFMISDTFQSPYFKLTGAPQLQRCNLCKKEGTTRKQDRHHDYE